MHRKQIKLTRGHINCAAAGKAEAEQLIQARLSHYPPSLSRLRGPSARPLPARHYYIFHGGPPHPIVFVSPPLPLVHAYVTEVLVPASPPSDLLVVSLAADSAADGVIRTEARCLVLNLY